VKENEGVMSKFGTHIDTLINHLCLFYAMVEDIKTTLEEKQKYESIETLIDNLTDKLKSDSTKEFKEVITYLENINKRVKLIAKFYSVPIEELNLPPRPYKRLKSEGIDTIGKIIKHSAEELRDRKIGFGSRCLLYTIEALNKYGLSLKEEYE